MGNDQKPYDDVRSYALNHREKYHPTRRVLLPCLSPTLPPRPPDSFIAYTPPYGHPSSPEEGNDSSFSTSIVIRDHKCIKQILCYLSTYGFLQVSTPSNLLKNEIYELSRWYRLKRKKEVIPRHKPALRC